MTDVVGWRIDDVVELIRGKKGTKVRLDVLPGRCRHATASTSWSSITREKVKLEEQAAKRVDHRRSPTAQPRAASA